MAANAISGLQVFASCRPDKRSASGRRLLITDLIAVRQGIVIYQGIFLVRIANPAGCLFELRTGNGASWIEAIVGEAR